MKKTIDLWKRSSDFQQAIYRVAFTGAILAILFFNRADIASKFFCSSYFAVGLFLFASIYHLPQPSATRRWITLVADISATSFGVYYTTDLGGVFIGIYLWLIIGYGLRYGNQYLKVAHLLSILGFIVSSSLNPYWSKNQFLVYGLLVTMTLVPVHIESLLRQLKVAMQAAEAATKAKARFLSHISHEIRTPLNGILSASDLMAKSNSVADKQHYLAIMQNSSELLKELVDNVLDLSKIENAKMKITPVRFNLAALINETTTIFSLQSKQKNINLSCVNNLADNTDFVGDSMLIKQVLVNLISNAVKFTDQGSITLKVNRIENTTTHHALVRFEVVDSGIGISRDALPHIFESFTQANNYIKYQYGGSGLGTTISRELVDLMGGKIGVESQLGVGSNFWFEIPLSFAENLAVEDSENHLKAANNVVQLKTAAPQITPSANIKARVLIADDNKINLFLLEKILQLEGYEVTSVSNGNHALKALETNTYDLLILDKNMPEKDGLEVTKILRNSGQSQAKLPIIIFTADSQLNEAALISEHDVNALITKPISRKLLLDKVSQLACEAKGESGKFNNVIDYNTRKNPKSAAYVNLQTLSDLATLDTQGDFMHTLINDYIASIESGLNELNAHITRLDYTHINSLGHAFAGSSANIGADALSEVFQALNQVTPYDQTEYTTSLVNKAFHLFESTKAELLAFQFKSSAIH